MSRLSTCLLVLLVATVTITGCRTVSFKPARKSVNIEMLKNASREELASILRSTVEDKPPHLTDVLAWRMLLSDTNKLVVSGELAADGIQVRDVALLLIEAEIGERLHECPGGTRDDQIKSRVSCTGADDTIYRFDVLDLTDLEFLQARSHLDRWISGYEEGRGSKSQIRDYPAK